MNDDEHEAAKNNNELNNMARTEDHQYFYQPATSTANMIHENPSICRLVM